MSTMNRANWITLAFSTVLFVVIVWCLSVGGILSTIAITILSISMLAAAITLGKSVFCPKDIGMRLAVVIKEDKKEVDLSKWDEYVSIFDNRSTAIAFWVTMVWQLALLSGLIYYGPLYVSVSYAVLLGLGELAKYRVYNAIKENKQAWGAAAYMVAVQGAFNKATNEGKEDKSC